MPPVVLHVLHHLESLPLSNKDVHHFFPFPLFFLGRGCFLFCFFFLGDLTYKEVCNRLHSKFWVLKYALVRFKLSSRFWGLQSALGLKILGDALVRSWHISQSPGDHISYQPIINSWDAKMLNDVFFSKHKKNPALKHFYVFVVIIVLRKLTWALKCSLVYRSSLFINQFMVSMNWEGIHQLR